MGRSRSSPVGRPRPSHAVRISRRGISIVSRAPLVRRTTSGWLDILTMRSFWRLSQRGRCRGLDEHAGALVGRAPEMDAVLRTRSMRWADAPHWPLRGVPSGLRGNSEGCWIRRRWRSAHCPSRRIESGGALLGPVRSRQSEHSGGHGDRDAPQRLHAAGIGPGKVLDGECQGPAIVSVHLVLVGSHRSRHR